MLHVHVWVLRIDPLRMWLRTNVTLQVYEVLVPTDDEKFLRQALHMLAEFACHIRCAPEDLAKERGAVLEVRRTTGPSSRGQMASSSDHAHMH